MPKKISEDITRYLKKSCDMEHIVFDLNKDNVESSADAMMNFFDSVYPNAFNNIISQMTFYAFISNSNDFELYLAFMKSLENKEKDIVPNDYEIIETFIHFIDSIDSFDTYYIIEKLIEHNLYKFKKISRRYTYKRIYFAHYLSNSEIQGIRKEMCINKILKNLNLLHNNPIYNFFRNIEELSKNDWELHKKLIKEGENPNEIAKVIRNDEIEKLQEISSQPNFDFNQIIEPSLYERCSFINKDNVTLIDYAAFFSSVKCFKYLLMNNAKVENTGKYAVAGGNEEIIHLCEQNHSSFEYAYETAIQFHRNDIFKYLYEKKLDKQNYYCYFYKQLLINSEKDYKNLLEIKCIQYSNYELFSYLNQNNEINIDIINEFAESGNLYLINCYFKNNKIPKDILISASKSGNVELVKYFIEEKGMNVNTKSDVVFLKFNVFQIYFNFFLNDLLHPL